MLLDVFREIAKISKLKMSSQDRRLSKLLDAYEEVYEYAPIECCVCGEWNLHHSCMGEM